MAELREMKKILKKLFTPNEIVENLYDVNLEMLKSKKIKGIILDMDNTIVPYNATEVDERAEKWINNAKTDFKVIILSNATLGSRRVKKIAKEMQLPYIAFSLKPLPFGFIRAVKILDISLKETAIAGDQLLTDILGGNILGLHTILVKPLSTYDFFTTKINRQIEKIILKIIK